MSAGVWSLVVIRQHEIGAVEDLPSAEDSLKRSKTSSADVRRSLPLRFPLPRRKDPGERRRRRHDAPSAAAASDVARQRARTHGRPGPFGRDVGTRRRSPSDSSAAAALALRPASNGREPTPRAVTSIARPSSLRSEFAVGRSRKPRAIPLPPGSFRARTRAFPSPLAGEGVCVPCPTRRRPVRTSIWSKVRTRSSTIEPDSRGSIRGVAMGGPASPKRSAGARLSNRPCDGFPATRRYGPPASTGRAGTGRRASAGRPPRPTSPTSPS